MSVSSGLHVAVLVWSLREEQFCGTALPKCKHQKQNGKICDDFNIEIINFFFLSEWISILIKDDRSRQERFGPLEKFKRCTYFV